MSAGPGPDGDRRDRPPRLFVAAAADEAALDALIAELRDELSRPDPGRSFPGLCAAAAGRSWDGAARLAVVGRSLDDLAEQLERLTAGETGPHVARGARTGERGPLAFVFSGQGPQWLGMGRQLFEQEPVFRAQIERCDEEVRQLLGWSVTAELFAVPETSRLDAIDVLQPVIYAFQIALAALLRSWGLEPDVVIGHSVGELAAAHVAGAISLADGARIACARSKVSLAPCTIGAMAVLGLSAEAVAPFLAAEPGRAWVAIHESPDSTVISGEIEAIERIVAAVTDRDLFARRVNAPVAGHTPMWDSLREALLEQVASVHPRAASVRMQSTVNLDLDAGSDDGAALRPPYWWLNLRSTVLFEQAICKLVDEGVRTFLELSPHPILSRAIEQCGRHRGDAILSLSTIRRREDERASLLGATAALFSAGFEPSLATVHAAAGEAGDQEASERQLDAIVLRSIERARRTAAAAPAEAIGETGTTAAPPAASSPARASASAPSSITSSASRRAEILAAAEPARAAMIEELLLRHLARVVGVPAAKLSADTALSQLGLDSLMALELRNRIRADLEVAPPLVRLVVSDASPRALALDLLSQLTAAAAPARSPSTPASPRDMQLVIGELTDDQVRALLRELEG